MRRKTIVSMALVLILGLTGAAFAKSGNGGKSMDGRHCRMGERGGGPMCVLNQLDLTAQQWEQVNATLDKHKDEMRTLHKKAWADRKALRSAIHADTFDEAKIRAAARTVAANMEASAVLRGKVFSEIRSSLTPEQIERMKKMQTMRQDRRKAMRGYDQMMRDDDRMPCPMMGGKR